MANWQKVPLEALNLNTDETLLSRAAAAMENCYRNEAGGASRFPGQKAFVSLPGAKTWTYPHRNNLIAVTNEGRCYRIDQAGDVQDVTGVPLSGGRRPIFAATEDELLFAAGGPILRLSNDKTALLSQDAPNTSHVAFIQGYVIAIEDGTGRFFHSEAGLYDQWSPLDVFTAETKPDPINGATVTPYNELLLAGVDSIEQFEPFPSGDRPFSRRWTTGEGLYAPYTLLATKSGTYGVNKDQEFVRFQLQASRDEGANIGLPLETIRDFDDAWTTEISIKGQKFIVLQVPNALSPYGTPGMTFIMEQRRQQWSALYGWDRGLGLPARWAPWSYTRLWGRHFVGVPGGVRELSLDAYDDAGEPQRMLVRTSHIDEWGRARVDNFRMRIKRGTQPSGGTRSVIGLRVNRDNRGFGRWKWRDLGLSGEREMVIDFGALGYGDTFQFEIQATDASPVEIVGMRAYVESLPR